MESLSGAAQLKNAIRTTVSGGAQVINAGRNVVLHGSLAPLPAGMSDIILICQYYQMVHGI